MNKIFFLKKVVFLTSCKEKLFMCVFFYYKICSNVSERLMISTKLLQKVRRSAKRKRAAEACGTCKQDKVKCSGYFPCTRCSKRSLSVSCLLSMQLAAPSQLSQSIGSVSSSVQSDGDWVCPPSAWCQTDDELSSKKAPDAYDGWVCPPNAWVE